jgi:D-tagatose-1,6-bisphosphate aldolase subunit GatZ/KbaZ
VKNARDIFLEIVANNKKVGAKGIYSVCSANAAVLEACFRQAREDGSILLVESTSNQVDQEGGYTGMKPADFVRYIDSIATRFGFPKERILLGGDHLGPNKWRVLPAGEAMNHAKVLIEEYVKAGFQKIHLDTSMFCVDDPGDPKKPLSDDIGKIFVPMIRSLFMLLEPKFLPRVVLRKKKTSYSRQNLKMLPGPLR